MWTQSPVSFQKEPKSRGIFEQKPAGQIFNSLVEWVVRGANSQSPRFLICDEEEDRMAEMPPDLIDSCFSPGSHKVAIPILYAVSGPLEVSLLRHHTFVTAIQAHYHELPNMTTCNSFPSFSALPQELRFEVWTLNLPGPRLVTLHYASTALDPFSTRGCTSPARIPANLQINREARSHAQKYYALAFNLPHFQPMVWLDPQQDILYFPPKEGWLGSWNHFVNALAMTAPSELGLVRRLAVSEALFRGVRGGSSPNVGATRAREFWEYVRRKFSGAEEVVVLEDGDAFREGRDEDVRVWMEGVLGGVLSAEDQMEVGAPEEKLLESLEKGLRFVEQRNGWVAPRWDVLRIPGDGDAMQIDA